MKGGEGNRERNMAGSFPPPGAGRREQNEKNQDRSLNHGGGVRPQKSPNRYLDTIRYRGGEGVRHGTEEERGGK